MNSFNGIIVMNKPTGISSHKCVSIARHALGMKKIGHTGTLDPEAGGVLPLLIGSATRAAEFLTADDKSYRATVRLGTVTDTLDMAGEVLSVNDVNCTEKEIREAVNSFIGEIEQIPPMYSAISVNGQRLYDLARQGIEVERKARKITVYSIDIVSINLPEIVIDVHCSKGTYIRTLACDIGEKLGCGGCISSLLRTKCGAFELKDAITPEELITLSENGQVESIITPVDNMFEHFESVHLDKKRADRVKNGVPIYYNGASENKTVRVYDENREFISLSRGEIIDGRLCLKLVKGFY